MKRSIVPRWQFDWTNGQPRTSLLPAPKQIYLYNPHPPYAMDWNGWARALADYGLAKHTPFTRVRHHHHPSQPVAGKLCHRRVSLRLSAVSHRAARRFIELSGFRCCPSLPPVYTTRAAALFLRKQQQRSAQHADDVHDSRTIWLLSRQQSGSIIHGHQLGSAFPQRLYRHGPLGIDQEIGSVKLSASYVATAGVHLASVLSPNGYGGADPAFAPYTQFNSAGPCHRRLRP